MTTPTRISQQSRTKGKKIQVGDDSDFIDILNNLDSLYKDIIQSKPNLTPQQKTMMEQDIKKWLTDLVKLLGPNIMVAGGEPLQVDSIVEEPFDEALENEAKMWDLRSREALKKDILERKAIPAQIDPLIQKADALQSYTANNAVFDTDNEDSDEQSLDTELPTEIKKEFKDSLELLVGLQKVFLLFSKYICLLTYYLYFCQKGNTSTIITVGPSTETYRFETG
ncbi:uncharacterized protein BX664DRAFT_344066 [Halteromyces radiatus]|uniref:uncharacterized protein n=1 Tax=Halteromyces radiatus TaxID=101107 RepID=UPI00221E4520|nr:uncharacterized protein BX664DRAFT_344066 [Halteromyces radiatus]KAI8076836.1 hypothetical protein BX664DRAFT_344066 [Halteromyces radiatus]